MPAPGWRAPEQSSWNEKGHAGSLQRGRSEGRELETQGLATDTGSVHRQGGYALPGSVQWIKVPAGDDRIKQAAAF